VPDISLDADPNLATPVKVYVGKTVTYIGGTRNPAGVPIRIPDPNPAPVPGLTDIVAGAPTASTRPRPATTSSPASAPPTSSR
jgi:hypothetical protein